VTRAAAGGSGERPVAPSDDEAPILATSDFDRSIFLPPDIVDDAPLPDALEDAIGVEPIRTDGGVIAYWISRERMIHSPAAEGDRERIAEMYLPVGIIQMRVTLDEQGEAVPPDAESVQRRCVDSGWSATGCVSRERLLKDPWASDLTTIVVPQATAS
jgi:hypothetical protein